MHEFTPHCLAHSDSRKPSHKTTRTRTKCKFAKQRGVNSASKPRDPSMLQTGKVIAREVHSRLNIVLPRKSKKSWTQKNSWPRINAQQKVIGRRIIQRLAL